MLWRGRDVSRFYLCGCCLFVSFPLFSMLLCFVIFSFSMRCCFKLRGAKQIPQHSSIELWILSLEACFKMLCAPDLVSFITSSHQETGCSQGSHTVQHSLTCLLPPCNVCVVFFLGGGVKNRLWLHFSHLSVLRHRTMAQKVFPMPKVVICSTFKINFLFLLSVWVMLQGWSLLAGPTQDRARSDFLRFTGKNRANLLCGNAGSCCATLRQFPLKAWL